MDNEMYSFALKNALDEIHSIYPNIKNSFVFAEDGKIIARDEATQERTIVRAVDSFDDIIEKAGFAGNVATIAIDGSKGSANVSCVNGLYIVTVTSKDAEKNDAHTVTRVLVSTILKLLERINPTSLKNRPSELETEPESPTARDARNQAEISKLLSTDDSEHSLEPEDKPEPMLPEPPVNQLMVENMGGLLARADTVRIDNQTLSQWQELYEDRKIEEVEIETFSGKTAQCRVKPIKGSKHEGNGIIQIHEKTLNTLEIKKGELVRVKPLVE